MRCRVVEVAKRGEMRWDGMQKVVWLCVICFFTAEAKLANAMKATKLSSQGVSENIYRGPFQLVHRTPLSLSHVRTVTPLAVLFTQPEKKKEYTYMHAACLTASPHT